jgi:DNA-binding transcriptional regulator YiaG
MTKDEIRDITEKKLSKTFLLLAQKYPLRKIESMVHIDRTDLSNKYKMSNIKISFAYADKVAKYVLKNKPNNINKIIKKFGLKGLSALIEYKVLSEGRDEKALSIKVKKMREVEGLSFIDISKILKVSCNTAHRLYSVSKNNKNRHSNIIFTKCATRDKIILEDYNKLGLSTKQLAIKYNLSPRQIRTILKSKFNIEYQARKLSDSDIERIVVLREQHKLTWPAIGYIFNISRTGAQYYYNDYYLKTRIYKGENKNVKDYKVNPATN